MQLLNHRGIKVKKTSVQSFFTFAQEQCPWFPEESSPPGSPHPPALARVPFPIKSLALSAHVSPRTIHFRVLDKSPVSGPGGGPLSCNWWGLFFAETDILTTRGTQGPACLPMDQTQRPQLGPSCPWSPPDADNWPERPTGGEQETLLSSLPFPLPFVSLALPILPFF